MLGMAAPNMLVDILFWTFIFTLFFGGGITAFVFRIYHDRRQMKLCEMNHRHRMELAKKIDTAVKLLMADDELRAAFMQQIAPPSSATSDLPESSETSSRRRRLPSRRRTPV